MDWLLKEDSYERPPADRNKFISRSILGILKALSLIRNLHDRKAGGIIYSISPVLKVVFMLFIIVLLSLSRSPYYLMAVGFFMILQACSSGFRACIKILAAGSIASIFSLVILLPSILSGNITNSIYIIIKLYITIGMVNTVTYTTRWDGITSTLKLLFIPDMFIFIFDITIRYIFILGDMALDMFSALSLRSIGKNPRKYSLLSIIAGNLFLKSKEMGDEMYSAMECRGFSGEYKAAVKFTLGLYDYVYGTIGASLTVAYFLIGRM